jgi:hypothetical protein
VQSWGVLSTAWFSHIEDNNLTKKIFAQSKEKSYPRENRFQSILKNSEKPGSGGRLVKF